MMPMVKATYMLHLLSILCHRLFIINPGIPFIDFFYWCWSSNFWAVLHILLRCQMASAYFQVLRLSFNIGLDMCFYVFLRCQMTFENFLGSTQDRRNDKLLRFRRKLWYSRKSKTRKYQAVLLSSTFKYQYFPAKYPTFFL